MTESFKSVRVWQMDNNKAKVHGVRRFTDYGMNESFIDRFDSIEGLLNAIYKSEAVYSINTKVADGREMAKAEELFMLSNAPVKPFGWNGAAMSVSDIVEIGDRYFYCDDCGFAEIQF